MKTLTYLLAWALFSSAAHAELSQEVFDRCLNVLQGQFAKQGIAATTFANLRPVVPDESVLKAANNQPEFKKEVWDYLAPLVDKERVIDGVRAKNLHEQTLMRIQSSYGVNMHHVLGVWGIESNFGKTLGKKSLFDNLATLSCFGTRREYAKKQYVAALKIAQQKDVNAVDITGSWAGAFGQTQFIPTTFLTTAVDFDGDGRRDIVRSVPDALASTANFLKKAGYIKGEAWGYEVKLGAYRGAVGRKNKKPLSFWREQGITLVDGSPLPNTLSQAGLLLPAGEMGSAFLVGKNFDSFVSYNNSENYALAIAHLSDLIAKNQVQYTGFFTAWPTKDLGVSRQEAREIQQALANMGYEVGAIDGLVGEATQKAIVAYQASQGMIQDGRAGQKLYQRLMTTLPTKSLSYVVPALIYPNNPPFSPQPQAVNQPQPVNPTIPQATIGSQTKLPIYIAPQSPARPKTMYRITIDAKGNKVLVPY